jgi:hypothetical protein
MTVPLAFLIFPFPAMHTSALNVSPALVTVDVPPITVPVAISSVSFAGQPPEPELSEGVPIVTVSPLELHVRLPPVARLMALGAVNVLKSFRFALDTEHFEADTGPFVVPVSFAHVRLTAAPAGGASVATAIDVGTATVATVTTTKIRRRISLPL